MLGSRVLAFKFSTLQNSANSAYYITMSSSRGLIYALGGVGLGYGAYFITVQQDVSKHEAEAAQVARMVVNEKKALQTAEKGIVEQESRIKELADKEIASRKQLNEKQIALENARQVRNFCDRRLRVVSQITNVSMRTLPCCHVSYTCLYVAHLPGCG